MDSEMEKLLINRVNIESKHGDRSFILLKGDILKDDGDLIVVNTYKSDIGETVGDFVSFVSACEAKEQQVYVLENGSTISLLEKSQLNFKRMLILNTNLLEGEQLAKESYECFIKGLFSSLAALELLGYQFPTISLPILLRKGLSGNYYNEAAILINHAVEWLKRSSYTNTIRYYVYLEQDMEIWNEAIEHTLGRSVVNPNENEDSSRLRQYILGVISTFPKDEVVYKDTLVPLQIALSRDTISPHVVAAFGRKLAETFCELITGKVDVTFNTNLASMRDMAEFDSFFIQSLYQIKAFGNTSIHRTQPKYVTNEMDPDDFNILLSILIKILLVYENRIFQHRVVKKQ